MSLDDRADLPYTQAVLMESMRLASIVPSGLAHSTDRELNFGGYTFPEVRQSLNQHANFFIKSVYSGLFLFYICPFLFTISIIQIEKSVDGLHGIQTHGHILVGADDTTVLWQQHAILYFIWNVLF